MSTFGDRAHETSTTTGTGTYSLAGAVANRLTLVAAAQQATGNNAGPWEVDYVADDGGSGFEVGTGTLTNAATDTLTRTTIHNSSNGGAAVNWAVGTRQIMLAPASHRLNELFRLDTATSAATASTLVDRDVNGRARFAAPSHADDAANKGYVDAADAANAAAAAAAQGAADDAQDDIDTHAARTDNPHAVTKAQVGLGSVLDFAQVYLAASSIAADGYARLTNGTTEIILQWGITAASPGGSETFPLAFPTACFGVVITSQAASSSSEGYNYVNNVTTTGFDFIVNGPAFWIALGH